MYKFTNGLDTRTVCASKKVQEIVFDANEDDVGSATTHPVVVTGLILLGNVIMIAELLEVRSWCCGVNVN